MNLAILWRLWLGAWGLLLVPWSRIRLMLGACSSISGPNLAQDLDIRLSSNRSVDHWATLQLLTFNVTCFINRKNFPSPICGYWLAALPQGRTRRHLPAGAQRWPLPCL